MAAGKEMIKKDSDAQQDPQQSQAGEMGDQGALGAKAQPDGASAALDPNDASQQGFGWDQAIRLTGWVAVAAGLETGCGASNQAMDNEMTGRFARAAVESKHVAETGRVV
jgi:hypothetical protein